jgi:hypothetical protein
MYSFEFSIEVNEFGRPVIVPSKKSMKELDLLENKFMCLELSRSLLEQTIVNHSKRPLPKDEIERIKYVHLELQAMSDIFALAIKEQMQVMNNVETLLNPPIYDLQVDTLNDLHNLNYNGIIYGEQIFQRKEGLRVMVIEDKKVYELKGGIDNEHWFYQ